MSLIKVIASTYSSTIFEDSKVVGVNWSAARWPKIQLSGRIGFLKCNISGSSFMGLNLPKIHIKDCIAKEVDFREANLNQANFTNTNFMGSQFIETNLTQANFAGAKEYLIDISLNKVKNAKFSLPEALSLLRLLDIDLVDP